VDRNFYFYCSPLYYAAPGPLPGDFIYPFWVFTGFDDWSHIKSVLEESPRKLLMRSKPHVDTAPDIDPSTAREIPLR
jgi:hypothetical protein